MKTIRDDIKFYGSCGENTYVFNGEHFRRNSDAVTALNKYNRKHHPTPQDLINIKGAGNASKAVK